MSRTHRVTISVDIDLWAWMSNYAQAHGLTVDQCIRTALGDYRSVRSPPYPTEFSLPNKSVNDLKDSK